MTLGKCDRFRIILISCINLQKETYFTIQDLKLKLLAAPKTNK